MSEELPADSIVPIAVVLDERTGYTLWAPPWEEDGEEWQAFLGSGGKVNLFTTVGQLAHYLGTDAEHDLTDHPAYDALLAAPKRALTPVEDYVFDLDGVYDLLAGGPDRWSVSELADTVDMVERIAECCEVDEVSEHLGAVAGLGLLEDGHTVFVGRAGEGAWGDIAEGLGEHWEPVLEALGEAFVWVEPVELDDDEEAVDEPEDDEDEDVDDVVGATALGADGLVGAQDEEDDTDAEPDDAAAAAFWESVGILPVRMIFADDEALTLRCYVDDAARFLGSESTVDAFRSADGLIEFIEEGAEHDLTGMSTWGAVVEAEADPVAAELDTYDFVAVTEILGGVAGTWDLAPLAQCTEAALDLAEYAQLTRVTDLLTGETELGALVTAAQNADADSDPVEQPGEEQLTAAAEQWDEVVEELQTSLRWHD